VAGYLARWSVDSKGNLAKNFVWNYAQSNSGFLSSLTQIPGKSAYLVTDPDVGIEIFDFSQTPAKSTAFSIPGQELTSWSAYSAKTGTFFVSDAEKSTITEISINKHLNPSIVKQYPQSSGSFTLDIAVATIDKKDFLFALEAGNSAVSVFSLNGPGSAQLISQLDLTSSITGGVSVAAQGLQGLAIYVES